MSPRSEYYDLPPRPASPMAWRQFFVYEADYVGANALAAGTVNGLASVQAFTELPNGLQMQAGSSFFWYATAYTATDPRVYVRYRDDRTGRFLQRGSLDLRDLAALGAQFASVSGGGRTAASFASYPWPVPHELRPLTVLSIQAADFSGAGNTVRIALIGAKEIRGVPPWVADGDGPVEYVGEPWPYVVSLPGESVSSAITASQTAIFATTIDQDGDFIVEHIVGQRDGAATVIIQDSSADRQWMSGAVHIDSLAGNGIAPHILPVPRFIRAGATITAQVADISAAANNVRLWLVGRKLQRKPRP